MFEKLESTISACKTIAYYIKSEQESTLASLKDARDRLTVDPEDEWYRNQERDAQDKLAAYDAMLDALKKIVSKMV